MDDCSINFLLSPQIRNQKSNFQFKVLGLVNDEIESITCRSDRKQKIWVSALFLNPIVHYQHLFYPIHLHNTV